MIVKLQPAIEIYNRIQFAKSQAIPVMSERSMNLIQGIRQILNEMHKAFVMKHVENPTCDQIKPLSEYLLVAQAENLIMLT